MLVKCGAPKPKLTGELASAQQVTVPVKSLYSASTTHLPLLTETGTLDVLTGVASATAISSAQVIERVKAGKVTEYAKDRTLNAETVIGAKPDVLMTQGTDDPQYPKLRQAGIAVVANAEWLEASPLGRAEWVEAMAALTGAEKRAGEVFTTPSRATTGRSPRRARRQPRRASPSRSCPAPCTRARGPCPPAEATPPG